MEERANKTIMCSVLFLDIVEYSKRSVAGQISLKDRFNSYLSAAIRDVPVTDRIILDTGDGAAINFIGDVEDALKAALSLRESLLNEDVNVIPPLLVRMGINLGPVRLVRDINGQPNIVGDGINVAQRVMGFAEAAQILVSRSYYDAVSRLSPQYAGMFHSQGSRTDKHVREHEIFAIGYPADAIAAQHKPGYKAIAKRLGWLGVMQRKNKWVQGARRAFQDASAQRRTLYIVMFSGALLLLLIVATKIRHRTSMPLPPVVETPKQTATQAASETVTVPSNIVEPKVEKKPRTRKEKPKAAPVGQDKNKATPSSIRTLEQTTAIDSPAEALVSIAVTPWGEVYLDGRMQGVSPPLTELHVTPGKHEIEIRNTTFHAYTQSIRVKAGEKIKIKHKFAN
ncbi:MAG: PEGA domain-containing protein [Gallionella sp.]|nr:PEGA domain-containing protein [Gallionella sp.]